MLETVNVSLQYGGRVLFEHADLKFTNGNCYGLIGANVPRYEQKTLSIT